MKIKIHLINLEPNSVKPASLLSFIRQRNVKGVSQVERASIPPKPNELGFEYIDILNFILEHADFEDGIGLTTAILELVKALFDWKKTNPSNAQQSFEIILPDGCKIVVQGDNEEEVINKVKKLKSEWKKRNKNRVKVIANFQ